MDHGHTCHRGALFDLCRRAFPYRDLSREDYEAVLEMLGEGIAPERGRYGAYLHRDRVNHRLHTVPHQHINRLLRNIRSERLPVQDHTLRMLHNHGPIV